MNATTLSQSLNRDYDNAFKILETDFILGKGLGGFSTNGARAYPHNLFLELFCELGMVGTLLIVMIVFVPLVVKPDRFRLLTISNFYALPLIVAIRVIHPVVFRFYIYFLHILLTFLFFYEWINYFHRFFCFCTFCMNSQIYRF